MRVCVFVGDLGTLPARRERLQEHVVRVTGDANVDVSFVGYRESVELGDAANVFRPYGQDGVLARAACQLFRLIDATNLPPALADAGLQVCARSLVEVVLACEPDAVALDVRWGSRLTRALRRDFWGRIFLADWREPSETSQVVRYDPSALVTIVLPTHNGSKHLSQSIQSCLDQTHEALELIVVDDGSTEDIGAIVARFDDRRIKFVRLPINGGISAALNTGFRSSTGRYLTWTSDDNYYAPDALRRMVTFLQRYPLIDFVYASSYIVDEMGLGRNLRVIAPKPPEHLQRESCVGACFLYNRRVYDEIGEYDRDAFLVEDYDYWIRVSKRFRMQRLFSPLYYYRYHPKSLTFKHTRDEIETRVVRVKRQNQLA